MVNRAAKFTWSLSHGIKGSIPVEKQTGVVYEISCKDCDDKHMGETLRSLKKPLAEHQRHAKDQRFDKSAVAEYATFNKHNINWENLKVIQKEQRWHNRKVKETLLINCRKPAMNKDVGLELSVACKSLLQWSFRRKEEKSIFFPKQTRRFFWQRFKFSVVGKKEKVFFVHRIIS